MMVAPVIRRVYLGAWAAGETKTGVIPMDEINGFKIVTAKLWGSASGTTAAGFGQTAQVGEGGVAVGGIIPLTGVAPYNPGDITGSLNETTGEFSLTDNSGGCLTDNLATFIEYRAEHPTLASDWDIGVATNNYGRLDLARVDSGLSNHGDCLKLTLREAATQMAVLALLKDPKFFTGNAVMSQAIIKSTNPQRERITAGLLQRVENRCLDERSYGTHLGGSSFWTNYQWGIQDGYGGFQPAFPSEMGDFTPVRVTPYCVDSYDSPANGAYFTQPSNRTTPISFTNWQWWRFITTVDNDDLHLQLLNASTGETNNLNPLWWTALTAWHRSGSTAASMVRGADMPNPENTTIQNKGWKTTVPAGIPPRKGQVGFYMYYKPTTPPIEWVAIDSFKAFVMP